MSRTFSIEIRISTSFSADEVWPDGDGPENPTVEDFKAVFFSGGQANVHQRCADWGLEIQKNDVRVTAHDPEDVRKLRELAQQLREKAAAG